MAPNTTQSKAGGSAARRKSKFALIGSGMIGSSMAQTIVQSGLGDVVIFDIVPGMPLGKGLDVWNCASVGNSSCLAEGTNDFAMIKDSDVVIVTAGLTKVPGKSDKEWNRDDLLPFNARIMRDVGEKVKMYCPSAFIICITNPLDVMVQVLQESSGVPPNMICGMAGILDSSRFRCCIAQKLNVSVESVQALVIGAHGEAMIPLPRYCSVNGIPLSNFIKRGDITKAEIDEIVYRTKHFGREIVQLLGQGSASLAPGAGAIRMAKAFLHDDKAVIPCAAYLNGEYNIKNLFVGVPVVLGGGGVERVIELEFNEEEQKFFDESISEIERLKVKMVEMEKEMQRRADECC